ncbi:hypothetical protein [Microlunatus ginsengisoli]|uniref:Uncharacterized protein n=1 Tax=Microlunatus ginsengisoli TaxID=363863 RepID=A0ABP6ZB71_9ACTN
MAEPVQLDVDEVAILRDLLSAHRSMVLGALHAGADVDVSGAFMIHAELSRLLARWDEFSANEQREIIRTIEYVVNSDDDMPDLGGPDGFVDDWERVRALQVFLGYG